MIQPQIQLFHMSWIMSKPLLSASFREWMQYISNCMFQLSWLQVPGLLKMGLLKRRNNWIRMSYGRDVMGCDRVKTCQYDWRCLCRHVSQRSSSCPNSCNCVAWLCCLHQSTELEKFASFSMSNPTICWYKIEYAGFNLLIYIEKVEGQKLLYFIPSHIFSTLAETCPNAHLVFWYWSLQNHNQTAASLDAKIC